MGAPSLMLVVLDSNVFISALISEAGPPHLIFQAWRAGRFEVATCPEQLEELRRASHYPKLRALIPPHVFGGLLNYLQKAVVVNGFPTKYKAEDSCDSFLLNLAVAAGAHYLVTGDKKAGLLAQRRIGQTRILTASSFSKTVLSQ